MDDRERIKAASRLQLRMARLVQLTFPLVHMLLERNGGSRDPEVIKLYHDRVRTMDRDVADFEKLLTPDTDTLMAPVAGTTPGQWSVELMMHVRAAAHALSGMWHPGSLKGADGRERLANPGDARLTWDEHPAREEQFQAAEEVISREVARVSCYLSYLLNARDPQGAGDGTEEEAQATELDHARDFNWVQWFGTLHRFTPIQRPIVEMLFEDWQAGARGLSAKALLANSGSESDSLASVFKTNGTTHAAWGTMIVRVDGQKDVYRLQKPPES